MPSPSLSKMMLAGPPEESGETGSDGDESGEMEQAFADFSDTEQPMSDRMEALALFIELVGK